MFYIKSQQPNGKTFKTEITDENVFTRCPECGCELPVDLAELLSSGEVDLFSSTVVCARCTDKKMSRSAGIKVPLTLMDMIRLENTLMKAGHCVDVQGLYDYYAIEDLEELSPYYLAEFGNALAKLVLDLVDA